MGDKIDKISDALEDREYKKTSQRLNETSNGGLGDDIGSAIETAGNKVNQVGETVENVGKGIETTGKGIEKAGNVVETTGKGVEAAGKGMQTAGKGMQATGQAMQTTGQGMKAAGEAVTPAGQAATEAGSGMVEGGAALSGTGVGAIVGVPLIIAGAGTAGAGIGATAAGTASTIGGTAMEGAGKGVESAGKGMESAGEGAEKAGQNIQKAGNKMKDAGKKVQDTGKSVQDTGKKISEGGRKLRNKGVKFREAANAEDVGDAAIDKAANAGKMAKKAVKKAIKEKKKEKKAMIDMMNPMDPFKSLKGTIQFSAIQLKKRIIYTVLLSIIGLVVLSFIYEMALGPIMEALEKIDSAVDSTANFHEKMDNFLSGLGFQDSEEAFYEELENLNKKYDKQLDIPLIMATLFYDDIQHNGESLDNGIEDAPESDGASGMEAYGTAYSWLKSKIKESNVTVGEDGMEYSSNKIYRLRKLAKHSFATGMFGISAKKKDEKTVSISDYLDKCKEQIGVELVQAIEDIPSISTLLDPRQVFESLYQSMGADEIFSTTDTGAFFGDNTLTHLYEMLKQIFWSTFADVKSVGVCLEDGDILCVTYQTYQADAEAYKNYLKKYYIRYMPEFKKYLNDKDEESLDKSIDDVIEDIENIKDEYESIFGVTEQNSEFYSNICKGNIKKVLLNELQKPVDVAADQVICFSGTYGYGTSGSLNHRGLDINESTTGNKEGDPVYSIYSNGVVTKSSKDKDFKCDDCKGGWLEIEYDAQLSDGAYKFKAIYGGLDPDSISLKSKDKVQKGDTIGKIGSKDDSEVDKPSLHFGMYDLKTKQYMDPENLFVSCGSVGSLRGDTNEDQIWNYLLDYGYSEAGVAGVMGNWQQESAFLPNNVEDCATVYSDDTFASQVASGSISKEKFKATVGNGCERIYSDNSTYLSGGFGFGLAQWTAFDRKDSFYEYWKSSGANLDDLQMQLEWYIHEADIESAGLHDYLKTVTDPYEAAKEYESRYEHSLGGLGVRGNNATALYNKHKGTSQPSSSSSSNKTVSKNSSCNNGSSGGGGTTVSGQSNAANKSREEKLQMVFPNGVPTSNAEAEKYLTTVECDTLSSGKLSVQVHKVIAQDVVAACESAKSEGFNIYSIGGYRSYSGEAADPAGTIPDLGMYAGQHGYGLAVDINPTDNGQFTGSGVATGAWDYKPNDPSKKNVTITESSAIYKSFDSNGWGWGGHFNSSKDYMHFSFFGT